MKKKLTTRVLESLQPQAKRYSVRDSEVVGFLVTVYPSGQKTFYYDFRNPQGRRLKIKLCDAEGRNPSEIRKLARSHATQVDAGKDPIAEKEKKRILGQASKSFGEFLRTEYKTHIECETGGNLSRPAEAISTLETNFADLLSKPMSQISEEHVNVWVRKKKKSGVSNATVNRILNTIKAAFSLAVEKKWLDSNPIKSVKRLDEDKKPKVRFLSKDERKRLFDALTLREERIREERKSGNLWKAQRGIPLLQEVSPDQFCDHLFPLVTIALFTGLRRGELYGLKWESLDEDFNFLTVEAETSKSGNSRTIPIHPVLRTEVFPRLLAGSKGVRHGLIFPSQDGKPFHSKLKSWYAVLSDAKIERFRFHDLRHSFASELVQNGVDLNTVRDLLGHADLKMTLRYAHLCPNVKTQAIEKLSPIPVPDLTIESVALTGHYRRSN